MPRVTDRELAEIVRNQLPKPAPYVPPASNHLIGYVPLSGFYAFPGDKPGTGFSIHKREACKTEPANVHIESSRGVWCIPALVDVVPVSRKRKRGPLSMANRVPNGERINDALATLQSIAIRNAKDQA